VSTCLDSVAVLGPCSASKYAGCNGGGAAWLPCSGDFFLRRCNRSFIHLRMFRLVTQMTQWEQSAEASGAPQTPRKEWPLPIGRSVRFEDHSLTSLAVHHNAHGPLELQVPDAALFLNRGLFSEPLPIHRAFSGIWIHREISHLKC